MEQPLWTWSDVDYSPNGATPDDIPSDMAIIGMPYDAGASATPGQNTAPDAVRRLERFDSWYDPELGDLSTVSVVDVGDVPIDRTNPMSSLLEARHIIDRTLKLTKCLVTIGGDHSVSAMVFERVSRQMKKAVDLVHLDAHSDTWSDDSLNAYPDHASWLRWVAERDLAASIIQYGVRTMNEPDDDLKITRRPGDLDREAFVNWLDNRSVVNPRPLYMSVDLDVVDPAFCPAVAYPEPGGWSSSDLLWAVQTVFSKVPVAGFDVVELTPALDKANMSVRLAHRCVLAARKGLKIRQG